MRELIFEQGNCSIVNAKHPVVKWNNPFLEHKHRVDNASTKVVEKKHYWVKWRSPFFFKNRVSFFPKGEMDELHFLV